MMIVSPPSVSFSSPLRATAPAEQPAQPAPAPADPPADQAPAIDWKSVGKNAAVGAAFWGVPAALGAIHPVAGMVGALGVGLYAAWSTKNPRGLILGAFVGMPSANLGAHWGVGGAALCAGLGALSLGLSNYIDQKRAAAESQTPPKP